MSRYDDRQIFTNNHKKYKLALEQRGVHKIKHYDTAQLSYPTADQIAALTMQGHTWKVGDRLYKLAYNAYGDPTLWWIIAWFNKKPTEADFQLGEVIQIPFPLDRVLELVEE